MSQTGDWIGMTQTSGISGWTHVINMAWASNSQSNWVSQIAFAAETGTGAYYRTTASAITSASWIRLIDASNIGSQSVLYATTAGALTSMNISQFTNNSGYITSGALAGYLPLTGGTITGDLTVNNKVYVGTHGCYFEEVLIGSTYELRVVDSAGNMTVLS
jgi:hypothetical protein